jgi:hypothetical protein
VSVDEHGPRQHEPRLQQCGSPNNKDGEAILNPVVTTNMATATGTPSTAPRRDERLYHPLEKLRGIIRKYVLIEGVLSLLLFMLAWFTIALTLDYGVFKAFGWDWVQDGAYGVRVTGLVVAVVALLGILIFRIVRRIRVEFSHSSLALVLERKFPQLLGDRLITAVELADVEGAARFGYSAAMIRKTIDEARERVDKVAVNEVFNWRRLRVMAVLTAVWALGLVALGFAVHTISVGSFQPRHAAWKSFHVATILAERNVLLRSTPWPRRALLELQDVGPAGIRIARDGGAPRVRVKAYRWVIVDRSNPNGWRPLLWADVTESLVGVPVPNLPDVSLMSEAASRPADAILEDEAVRGQLSEAMGAEGYSKLTAVFDRLEDMAADPSFGRRLRKLEKPASVSFKYFGLQSAGEGELKSEGNNEFAGEINGLKEDVLFRVRAEDFRTPERGITLVPPPALMNLMKEEYQPAYLHYASPYVPDPNDPTRQVVAGYSVLAGLRQRVPDEKLAVTGDRTVFTVPVGSEVVIHGITERPIAQAWLIPKRGRIPGGKVNIVDGKELRSDKPVPATSVGKIEERDGNKVIERGTFTIAFRGADRITGLVEFDIDLVNDDGVFLMKRREMQIDVIEDQPPVVEVIPEVVRKVGKEFWVTPRAKIPFNPESNIRDDGGISKIAYSVTYEPKDAHVVRSLQVANLGRATSVPMLSGQFAAVFDESAKFVQQLLSDEANARKEASFGVALFAEADAALKRETLAGIKSLLNNPMPAGKPELVKRVGLQTSIRQGVRRPDGSLDPYKWAIEGDFFDIGVLKNLEAAPGDVQPRYEFMLAIEATDTNFDTGPRVTRNEPIPFLIVSAADLLVEIGKDEERLGLKLDDALKKLEGAKTKYEFVRSKAERQLPDELEAVKIKSKDAWQDVLKARENVQVVTREFRRIERECIFNQLDDRTIATYGKFANRLDRVLDEPTRFVSEDEERLWGEPNNGGLRPLSTFATVDKLMSAGQTDFDQGRWTEAGTVTTASIELFRLHEELAKIRAILGEAQSKERLRNLIRSIRDNQERIGQAIVAWSREADADKIKDTPKLGSAGPFFLAKGETKRIRQTIKWRQYDGDTVTVKVVASDPSIVVPAELTLDFEKNNLDFEYEVRSGTKEGDFTITLTPVVGPNAKDKVEVVVVELNVK